MYSIFKIKKLTGTYSEIIEMIGLANLLNQIQSRLNRLRPKLQIEDKELYYELKIEPLISEDDINEIEYFPFYQYVIRNKTSDFEGDYFDYPKQNNLKKERQAEIKKAHTEFVGSKKYLLKGRLKEIDRIYSEEKKIFPQLDVYAQLVQPINSAVYEKLYTNTFNNQKAFSTILKTILDNYSKNNVSELKLVAFNKTVTALQLFNPTTGKGLNKNKASGATTTNLNLPWISETMKTSGSLSSMICQLIKVGNSYDLKIVVPDFKKIEYNKHDKIVLAFKKNLKGNTPLKTDILNLLIINKQLIEHTDEYANFKAKNILNGLRTAYQKDLGQNKAVANIASLDTPNFIEFNTEDQAKDWIAVLDDQIHMISGIDELGDATQGLIAYRTFLTSSQFESWMKFAFWYSGSVMIQLAKKKYVHPLKTNSLNKLLNNIAMNNFKISEITSNEGFKKVAYAIRKSTITLQYTPKEQRKFEIRYGLAQTLQNKSKSPYDLAEFIGEFIATYNAETAKYSENTGVNLRKNIRENELDQFYKLLDEFPSKVVGALLASYGFALTEKEASKETDGADLE